ncbi:MAG TPA: permease prefix domain 1-containing protein [Bryobacteraceae bacterium]|nr:permease prefix domain 1-containing protein [Bryobacteraceae bacterium]
MRTDRLIDEIVSAAQIPSASRRREVWRELRAHVEDFVICARNAGHTEEEAERLAVANFGDPRQIAMQLGWVYRQQRAVLRVSVFVLSAIAVAVAIAAMVMSLQAGLAIGRGVPLQRAFSARHTMIEAADILASATAWLGLISLEKLFEGRRFTRAAAALTAIFAILIVLFRIAGAPWRFLLFGLLVALFLRAAQTLLKSLAARTAAVLACFGLYGMISFGRISMASWLVMGAGYLAMTHVAVRVDRALFRKLQGGLTCSRT